MPTPRVTIDDLPEAVTLADTDVMVIQDAGTTRKATIATFRTLSPTPLDAHLADLTDAHDATSVSTADSGNGVDGATVQAQLEQLAALVSEVTDVLWVGADVPDDPVIEIWWDTDAPYDGALKVRTDIGPDVWTTVSVAFASDSESIDGELDDKAVTPAGLAAALNADQIRTINTYSATTLTAVLSDAGTYVRCTGTDPTYTVPPNASVAFEVGTQIEGVGTASAMTIAAGSGVTLNKARSLVTTGADSGWTLIKVAADEWDVHGGFETEA